jgi:ketosteroid isomerase-like protein
VDRSPKASAAERSARHSPLTAVRTIQVVKSDEDVLRAAYAAFNARDVEAALELMHPEVDWSNAWEGGRAVGRRAVADYWRRQFEQISSTVEPERFDRHADGGITVTVHQVVRDASSGEIQSDTHVLHRYRLAGGLVTRMDVLNPPSRAAPYSPKRA